MGQSGQNRHAATHLRLDRAGSPSKSASPVGSRPASQGAGRFVLYPPQILCACSVCVGYKAGMTSSEEMCARLGVAVSDVQRRAFRYLEQQGMRFCSHFGYENAVAVAQTHWRTRRHAQRQARLARGERG